jgi:hypothetical protein
MPEQKTDRGFLSPAYFSANKLSSETGDPEKVKASEIFKSEAFLWVSGV